MDHGHPIEQGDGKQTARFASSDRKTLEREEGITFC
jgi:hypothetical protein